MKLYNKLPVGMVLSISSATISGFRENQMPPWVKSKKGQKLTLKVLVTTINAQWEGMGM